MILAGRKFVIRKQFLEDIAAQELSQKIHRLIRALLVMHSPQDDIVDIDHARRIYEAALHPKSFISLDKSDHLLNDKRDAEYAAEIIGAWVSRYLPVGETDADNTDNRRVAVSEAGIGKYTQHVTIGPHHLIADEPESHGGHDSGPTPYDFLLTALGACINMTVRMYADRKKLPLKHVEVQLVHDKIHAADCENCETGFGRIDRIQRSVSFTGELDVEQRRRLLEIADKCPVHRTLNSEIFIGDFETT